MLKSVLTKVVLGSTRKVVGAVHMTWGVGSFLPENGVFSSRVEYISILMYSSCILMWAARCAEYLRYVMYSYVFEEYMYYSLF